MNQNFFIEVDCHQINKFKQVVCGDVFLQHKIKDENRIVTVLSDGLGSGIKANVLATLTSTMALNFISNKKDIRKTAETIMKTLPVCKVRKISYSTFTIVDIDSSGNTRIIEYDNPSFWIIRDGRYFRPQPVEIKLDFHKYKESILNYYQFESKMGDRIVFYSDGVIQSGIGTRNMPLGWGLDNAASYLLESIKKNSNISARDLAKDIVYKANLNDEYKPKDDITGAVIYFRKPRKMMVFTGPPLFENRDSEIVKKVFNFEGTKVICGGTTAKIFAREMNLELHLDLKTGDEEVPPCIVMQGIDLVTEGTYTLSKVLEILEQNKINEYVKDNAASKFINLMMNSDIIHFIVGTKINQAHQDPNIPVELGIRRNLIKSIIRLLEERYLKQIDLVFV